MPDITHEPEFAANAKPVKPQRMWSSGIAERHMLVLQKNKDKVFRRPVLIIDLSPESVAHLEARVFEVLMNSPSGKVTTEVLTAIGIVTTKGGRK